MLNVIRKNQRVLFIVIAFLAIPFIFYFSKSDPFQSGSNVAGRIHGQPVSVIDYQRNMRLFVLAQQLGLWNVLQDLSFSATSDQNAHLEFAWNRMVLRHEAERLGIRPTAQEVAGVIRELQPFRGEGGSFDPARYDQFVREALPSLGFTEAHIQELASDQLVTQRMRDMLAIAVEVPQAEAQEMVSRAYGRLTAAVVRLRTEDFNQQVQISDEDVQKFYEAQRAALNTDEKRRIAFVTFALNEEQKQLQGRERIEVLQKLADRATDFNQALLENKAPFDQLAQQFELPVQTTSDFPRSQPDPALAQHPQLVEAAFRLTQQEPNSDPIQAGDGFYVLHLASVMAPQPLTLEEARPRIEETLRNQRSRALMMARATDISRGLRDALKAGASIDEAAAKVGAQIERVPTFALADPPAPPAAPGQEAPPPEAPDLQMIKGTVAEMSAGEVSEFVPTPTGGLIAVLERRDEPDAAAAAQGRADLMTRMGRARQDIAFYEWLRERRQAAGVPQPNENDAAATTS
jgi:peptidyl-prolyl cis-trans isomerase D